MEKVSCNVVLVKRSTIRNSIKITRTSQGSTLNGQMKDKKSTNVEKEATLRHLENTYLIVHVEINKESHVRVLNTYTHFGDEDDGPGGESLKAHVHTSLPDWIDPETLGTVYDLDVSDAVTRLTPARHGITEGQPSLVYLVHRVYTPFIDYHKHICSFHLSGQEAPVVSWLCGYPEYVIQTQLVRDCAKNGCLCKRVDTFGPCISNVVKNIFRLSSRVVVQHGAHTYLVVYRSGNYPFYSLWVIVYSFRAVPYDTGYTSGRVKIWISSLL